MKKLFLDDIRVPNDVFLYTNNEIYLSDDWTIVRTYDQFIKYVLEFDIPDIISWDHDLGEDDVEIWKDVVGYEGIYQVSTLGNVMRVKNNANNLLKPDKQVNGLWVMLRNKGNDKRFLIHRLVGKTFIKNPKNKPEINHRDGNRWNNNINNLEWVTSSENNLHAHNELNRTFTAYGENHANSKRVSQYDIENNYINTYGSVNEAGRQLKIKFGNIAKCARGERKTAGNYIWKYDNNNVTISSKINHIIKNNDDYISRYFIPEYNDKTGYDCTKWLVDYCIDNNKVLPSVNYIHSMNPYGAENIKALLNNFAKTFQINNVFINKVHIE